MFLFKHLNKIIKKLLKANFGINEFPIELTEVPNPEMGDLAFPCFSVANLYELKTNKSQIKKKISVAEIARILANQIKPDEYIEKTIAIGPYLNFFLNKKKIFEIVCRDPSYSKKIRSFRKKPQKIILEFSSPNTNKPLHLGHLRNIILGTSLANLLEAVGNKVIRADLINDRGIHICKSMLAYEMSKAKGQRSGIKKGDHLVGEYYTIFEKRLKNNPELLEKAREMLRKWEAGDKKILALGKKMNKWALDGFKETYKRLGVWFDKWYFESKIYKRGRKIILEALKRGRCYQREDKAVEIDLVPLSEDPGLGKKVLLRPDGTSVYITQDIALAKLKFDHYNPDKSIYLTGHEQEYHFEILFKILKHFGFSWVKKCEHLWHGMVFLPEGKMKSREGKVVEADELMDEMKELAKQIKSQKKYLQSPTNTPDKLHKRPKVKNRELEKNAEKIGLVALKFYLLKFNPKQEINFKPKESLSFEGATGVYVLYAYVRIQSIIAKLLQNYFEIVKIRNKKINFSLLKNQEEWEIGKLLFWYPQIIQKAALNYNPAYLTEHLLKLATAFNKFYEKHSILSAETEELAKARLRLITTAGQSLRQGMGLLGIEVVKRM